MTDLAWLHGLEVDSIRDLSDGHYWEFRFGENTFFNVAEPWRIDTADVSVLLEGDHRLDVFNESSGYEGWQLKGYDGRLVVALGGGQIAEWGS